MTEQSKTDTTSEHDRHKVKNPPMTERREMYPKKHLGEYSTREIVFQFKSMLLGDINTYMRVYPNS